MSRFEKIEVVFEFRVR